jgi:NAD-dependent deacetylase
MAAKPHYFNNAFGERVPPSMLDLADARVLVITGAGISAESGIPTFRGKDGYWRNLAPTKLATPEAFARDPQLVWEWYRERRRRIRAAEPNAAHKAVVDLADRAGEFLLVTQNVDDLHARAGMAPAKMVQIHGDIFVTRCSRCEVEQKHDYDHEQAEIPKCHKCGALMRPGVVWFGEMLEPRKLEIVENYVGGAPCDLVLVIGTTALFGYIVDWAIRAARNGGELIEINPSETQLSSFATRSVRGPAAAALPKLVNTLCSSASAVQRDEDYGET